jgi:metal-responsive CopG/Arc/MetJ family transcriptional regulator
MARVRRTHGTISLPVALLEEIDKVVRAGLMGFRSRAELVAEATRAYLRDLHGKR